MWRFTNRALSPPYFRYPDNYKAFCFPSHLFQILICCHCLHLFQLCQPFFFVNKTLFSAPNKPLFLPLPSSIFFLHIAPILLLPMSLITGSPPLPLTHSFFSFLMFHFLPTCFSSYFNIFHLSLAQWLDPSRKSQRAEEEQPLLWSAGHPRGLWDDSMHPAHGQHMADEHT